MSSFILTVDDESDIRELVKDSLEKGGHEVAGVKKGEKALTLIEEKKPDLVLLDQKLQRLTGWDILKELYGENGTNDVPVAMLTGERLTISKMLREDMENLVAYLEKPVEPNSLLKTVENILEEVSRIRTLKEEILEKSPENEKLAEAFETWSRAQMIHEFLLEKLKNLKSDCSEDQKRRRLEDLMEEERKIIRQSRAKKEEILKSTEVEMSDGLPYKDRG